MSDTQTPLVIKKYANRRLYNTDTSTYVTLEDLADMVKAGSVFVVSDAKTGDDITRSVLTQIIFEQENKGQNLLPIAFLRQLITYYGDSLQNVIPGFLESSIQGFAKEQENFRDQLTKAFGAPFEIYEEQVRQNLTMFDQAFRMFLPFANTEGGAPTGQEQKADKTTSNSDLEAMRRQMLEMQRQLDVLAKKKS